MGNNKFLYLVKVESDANNNKFYRMVQLDDNNFKVEYGRIGVGGFQESSYPISQWDKKYKEKLKKGYLDQTRLVAESTIKQNKNKDYISISNNVIASIVNRLQAMAKQAIADNYTVSTSKVTQVMIDEAQVTLNNLMSVDNVEGFNRILIDLFNIIPRKMSKVKDNLVTKIEEFAKVIQKEQDLLDVMKGQVTQQSVEEEVVDTDENKPTQTILDVRGLIFEEITNNEKELIKRNLGDVSNKFFQAWKVINTKTQKEFNNFIELNNVKNIKNLWHGSRNENWWSIINSGLVLRPSAVITGKMFGHGIYFAPKAQKSLGYTSLNGSYWAGGNSNSAFMSLYDVAYGKPYDVHSFDSKYHSFNYEQLQKYSIGANCLHAHSGSMLRNDEIIVYKEEQTTIKYLVELR